MINNNRWVTSRWLYIIWFINNPLVKARIEFTFSANILHYVSYLKYHVLPFTPYEPTPWANPKIKGKT